MRWRVRFFGDSSASEIRAAWLVRTLAVFGLALLATTWRLWTPQLVFPQVPLFYWAAVMPAWCEWAGGAAIVLGLCGALAAPNRGRWQAVALAVFASSTSLLMLVDQERLQPWAYQFVLVALVLALADRGTANKTASQQGTFPICSATIRPMVPATKLGQFTAVLLAPFGLLRLLIVSFYFHSALSKFDYSFLHTLGQQFLAALAASLGASIEAACGSWLLVAAAIFPGGELLVALGLCFARTMTVALAGAVLLHVLLLVILGPWGLNHKPGVLIWNVYFIFQDLLLFWPAREPASAAPATAGRMRLRGAGARFASSVIVAAVLLPFLAPIAWFDMWPAWGLYASSAERVTLLVHRREVDRLPDRLRTFVSPADDPDEPWMTLRLDRWALDVLGAPIYPQSRYQLGVADAVIARYQLGHRARVIRSGLANRFTGERRQDVFSGLPQLSSGANEYIFNTHPRPTFARSGIEPH
ncbi:MAG: hypothetical protein HY288_18730 [Planctomycetia bacterium]|nr:hypothetical protein [Planctomycetia bacterium]